MIATTNPETTMHKSNRLSPDQRYALGTWLATDAAIHIISGEGEHGSRELYRGKRTIRALLSRLTRERCHGDRWARADIYSHDGEFGAVGRDIQTGEQSIMPQLAD